MQLHSPKPPIVPLNLPFRHPCTDESSGISGSTASFGRRTTRTFTISKGTDERLYLSSDAQTTELQLSPWTFVRDHRGIARVENVLGAGIAHVDLFGASVSSPVCQEIQMSSRRLCDSLLYDAGVLLDGPAFHPPGSVKGGFVSFMGGCCLYAALVKDDFTTGVRYIEIQLPSEKRLLGCEPVRLAIFSDPQKSELVELLPLGLSGNKSVVRRGLVQSDETGIPEEVITINGHAFRFRCVDEATLWKVAIEDCTSCSIARFNELLHPGEGRVPKGYRGQHSHLRARLSQSLFVMDIGEFKHEASLPLGDPIVEPDWSWKLKAGVVVLCFTCSIFTQYQSVAPCLFAFHALYLTLVYIERKRWLIWAESVFIGFGLTLSMSQIFRPAGETGWDWTSFGIVLGLQTLVVHLFLLIAIVHCGLSRSPMKRNVMVLCYPTLVCCAYAIVALYTPLASQASMAYALSEWSSFIQVVSVFGLSGLNMVVVTTATCLAHFFVIDIGNYKRRIFSARLGVTVFILTWFFGSFRLAAPWMYQRAIEETAVAAPEWVDAACIVRSDSGDAKRMIAMTSEALESSSNLRFIMWSEAASVDYYDDLSRPMTEYWQKPVLSTLINQASSLASTYNATVGVTYTTWVNPDKLDDSEVYNKLTFIDNQGAVIGDYSKRYPVPVIEADVVGSGNELGLVTNSSIGDFNDAICYDLDRPEFIRSGASTGVLWRCGSLWISPHVSGETGYRRFVLSGSKESSKTVDFLLPCGIHL
ncbi:hypothetical protein C9890_0433 [Perkinsus sp. BL_2016]|nr:hypothetical protein C9890_0433 [Perkinsus sp. BL_2016]